MDDFGAIRSASLPSFIISFQRLFSILGCCTRCIYSSELLKCAPKTEKYNFFISSQLKKIEWGMKEKKIQSPFRLLRVLYLSPFVQGASLKILPNPKKVKCAIEGLHSETKKRKDAPRANEKRQKNSDSANGKSVKNSIVFHSYITMVPPKLLQEMQKTNRCTD